MLRAHELGQIPATNELGLLHLEQPSIKDLDLAEYYLTLAYEAGDDMAGLNLASLEAIRSPKDCGRCIEYLRAVAPKAVEYDFFLRRTLHALETGTKDTMPMTEGPTTEGIESKPLLEAEWMEMFGVPLDLEEHAD